MEEDCITFSERGQCVIALGKFLQVHESCTASTEFSGNVCARLREIIDTNGDKKTVANISQDWAKVPWKYLHGYIAAGGVGQAPNRT